MAHAAWEVITTDFLTQLPASNGCDAIQIVVCKLTKRPCYIPTTKTADAATVAELMFRHCFRQYGFPRVIMSGRDPKFTSEFWTALMELTGIKVSMTVAYRAQADGQSERQIRTLEDSLRCVTSHYGADWFFKLPLVEFAHATLVSASSGYSHFQLDTGSFLASHLSRRQHRRLRGVSFGRSGIASFNICERTCVPGAAKEIL